MSSLIILFLVTNLVLALLSLPMILRRIPPNGLYGFRVRATLNDPELWYDVNEYAGWRMLVSALVGMITSIVLAMLPGLSVDVYSLAFLAVIVVTQAITMAQSFAYIRQHQKQPPSQ